MTKHVLAIRPVFHWKPYRIKAHKEDYLLTKSAEVKLFPVIGGG
jgi:hypothetical protein